MTDPKNSAKLIGTCSCGYCNRIGFACRHFFCMLFTVLRFSIVSIDSAHSVINLCNCASSPRSCIHCMENPHFKKFEWGNFDFMSLINLDIGSKMKYHATLLLQRFLHSTTLLFIPESRRVFLARLPFTIDTMNLFHLATS